MINLDPLTRVFSLRLKIMQNFEMNQEDFDKPELSVLAKQVGGDHYKKLYYQPITFFQDVNLNTALSYAIKYLSRYPNKNMDDLDKAIHCIELFDNWIRSKTYTDANVIDEFTLFMKFTSQFQPVIQIAMLDILNLASIKVFSYDADECRYVFNEVKLEDAIHKAIESIEKVRTEIVPF